MLDENTFLGVVCSYVAVSIELSNILYSNAGFAFLQQIHSDEKQSFGNTTDYYSKRR